MTHRTALVVDDLITWTKTLAIDLPLTSTQWAFGTVKEETVTTTAWQGYDAGVRLLTNAIDAAYRSPISSVLVDRLAVAFLRWERLRTATSSTVFPRLSQLVGLPTMTHVRGLEETIARLTTEVQEQRSTNETLALLATRLLQTLENPEQTPYSQSDRNGRRDQQRRFGAPRPRTALYKET
ncbi:MAG: hypothetical protein AB7G75_02555 [Candidatus Binatia bacterium]